MLKVHNMVSLWLLDNAGAIPGGVSSSWYIPQFTGSVRMSLTVSPEQGFPAVLSEEKTIMAAF